MINVSIVIYNQNPAEILSIVDKISKSKCVEHIYIVDNSKNYNSELASFKGITYIFNNKNIGYGAGHNIALKKTIQASIKYHLVLNPDIIIESNVLERLFEQLENDKDVGLIMPNIKYPDGQTQHLCKLMATPIDLIGRRFIPFKKWKDKKK